jgi:peptide/nickel transport system permease protein
MLRFLARRFAGLLATLLASSFVIFGAVYLAPGSTLAALTGGRQISAGAAAAIAAQYHLDQPFLARYGQWLVGLLHGDLGKSLIFREDVATLLLPRLANTLLLVAYASLIVVGVGVALGVRAGARPGAVSTSITVATTFALAIPSFVAAVALISFLAVQLGWFPVIGANGGDALERLRGLTLPALALALGGLGYVARVTKAAVANERERDHVLTAQARGIPPRLAFRRHVLRNAMIPVTTVSGLMIASLFATTAVVETAFGLNGIGAYLVESVQQKDFAVVQAISLIFVLGFVVLNTLVDVLYGLLDPRISLGGR